MISPSPPISRSSRLARVLVAVTLATVSVVATTDAGADTASERAEVRRRKAIAAADLDTLRATDAQVDAALTVLNSNVSASTAALREAERQAALTAQALVDAEQRVAEKQAEILALNTAIQRQAVEAFVRPPSATTLLESLESQNIGEAELKAALLEAGQVGQIDALDQLERVREDLETARGDAARLAGQAASTREAVDARLAAVTLARDQQVALATNVQARLDRRLAEVEGLAGLDKELSERLAAEQAALARRVASAGGGGGGGGGGGPVAIVGSGSIVSVRGIQVHRSIADNLARMLSAADAAGISLSGGGYRSSESQIRVRRNNCGSSYYAIYQMPASQCRPPTARPGQSMHERGLAIDFTYGGRVIGSRSSPAYRWLSANAAGYGFYNLPSEPWHWSVNGR